MSDIASPPDLVITVNQVTENGDTRLAADRVGDKRKSGSTAGKYTFLQIKLGPPDGPDNPLGEPFYDPFRDLRRVQGEPKPLPSLGDYIWNRLQNAIARTSVPWDEQVDFMRGYGELLWSKLPPQFHQFYWDTMHGRDLSILIQSDALHFPWELVWPMTQDGQQTGPEELFGIAFSIGRWPTQLPLQQVALPSRWVVFAYKWPSDGNGRRDIDALNHLFDEVEVLEGQKKQVVVKRLKARQSESFYFRTHGWLDDTKPGIKLGNEDLRPAELKGLRDSLSGAMVFANACVSGGVRPNPTALPLPGTRTEIGWPLVFLQAGCAAFLGPYFQVNPEFATQVSASFFALLKDGDTIGDAMRKVRQSFLNVSENSFHLEPGFLAYTVIGHPGLRINQAGPDPKTLIAS
jgi:CHAT domain